MRFITVILLVAIAGLKWLTLAQEQTKTFIHEQNGYAGYESVCIADPNWVQKWGVLEWWLNNALSRKNDVAADVGDLIC
jgi:hypothetical protein